MKQLTLDSTLGGGKRKNIPTMVTNTKGSLPASLHSVISIINVTKVLLIDEANIQLYRFRYIYHDALILYINRQDPSPQCANSKLFLHKLA